MQGERNVRAWSLMNARRIATNLLLCIYCRIAVCNLLAVTSLRMLVTNRLAKIPRHHVWILIVAFRRDWYFLTANRLRIFF